MHKKTHTHTPNMNGIKWAFIPQNRIDWLVPMWPMPTINQSPRLLNSTVMCRTHAWFREQFLILISVPPWTGSKTSQKMSVENC